MCFAIRRGVGLHLNVCGTTQGEVKNRLLFRLESLDFENLRFSTMEGSEIGLVRLLRDEKCHRWWRARFSGEPRLFGKSGSYPWTFISDSRRGLIWCSNGLAFVGWSDSKWSKCSTTFCWSQGIVGQSSSRRGFRRWHTSFSISWSNGSVCSVSSTTVCGSPSWWHDGCWFDRRWRWFSHGRTRLYWRSLHSLVSSKCLEWVCIYWKLRGSRFHEHHIHWEVWGHRHQCWGTVRGEWWIDRFGFRSFTSCWRNEDWS